jgi:membrane protease subunit HflK
MQLQERLQPYRLGIQVRSASIVLAPPDEVKFAFDEVTQAQIRIASNITKAREDAERRQRLAESEKLRIGREAASYAVEQRRAAEAEAEAFESRRQAYHQARRENPNYLNAIWWAEMDRLLAQLKRNGQIDLLDRHLSGDALDITQLRSLPNK